MKATIKFHIEYVEDSFKNIKKENIEYAIKRVLDGWHNPISGNIIVDGVVVNDT